MAALIARELLFPCFPGSALKLSGVQELLLGLERLAMPPAYPSEFAARVYQIGRDAQGNRLTYLKVTGGCLRVRASVLLLAQRGAAGGKDQRAPLLFRCQI